MTEQNGIPAEVMELLRKVSTGMVEDALRISGIKTGISGIRPIRGFEDVKVIGPAATVLFSPARPGSQSLNNYIVIEQTAPGSVLVIDGKGYEGHFTGDHQGALAKRQGLAGMIVYGGARDFAGYRAMGMPLYCTSAATRDKPDDWKLTAYNVPIEIGGVTVKPGDVIVADEDGVVAIPSESFETLIQNMEIMFEIEEGMDRAIKNGAPASELAAIIGKKKPKK